VEGRRQWAKSSGQWAIGSGQFAKVSFHKEFCEKYLMFVVIKNEK
jgi:hypothetical protein